MRTPCFNSHDPHQFLGLHTAGNKKVIRIFRPDAKELYLQLKGEVLPMARAKPVGVFELQVDPSAAPTDYKIYHHSGLLAEDPYSFPPSIGELDLYLFNNGVNYKLFNILGAHRIEHQNVRGVRFAVWAPAAQSVALVADFNHFDGRVNPMRSLGPSGIWELFVPGLDLGEKYKFEIRTSDDKVIVKSDPYAFRMEERPRTASIVSEIDRFAWTDQEWLAKRKQGILQAHPINVFEIHAGSWRTPYGRQLTYRELAVELVKYCRDMGYTHVEFLPIQEHPLDESWGYQVSGFYAVTSRFGTPEDFQWLVDHLHNNHLGVILDWVPGHFPTDDFSLARFDGTALYEHEDPREGFHPHWNTLLFNFGRREVSNFLIANALFWFEKMHVDGLRVDAVASMLYRDYGREAGQWIPNAFGGNINLETVEFFKHLNSVVHAQFPDVLMIAEESSSFAGVTTPVQDGGLGFDMKWNMGWMNDTLRYFANDPIYRRHHHKDLTFGLLYAFSEKFMLALSHDEAVHGKKSLLNKMPGDQWQKFANLRLLLSYQICQPGKKLLFMGAEFGQWKEWACKGELDWVLLDFPMHRGVQQMARDLNHFYLQNRALWERDFEPAGFSWVDFKDENNSVISYLRKSHQQELLCVHNFTPTCVERYRIPLQNVETIQEVFNSDKSIYGGSGKINPHVSIHATGIDLCLAPLATMIFAVQFKK